MSDSIISIEAMLWYKEELKKRGYKDLPSFCEHIAYKTKVDISVIRSIVIDVGIENLFSLVEQRAFQYAEMKRNKRRKK